jgi:hypothetical protein
MVPSLWYMYVNVCGIVWEKCTQWVKMCIVCMYICTYIIILICIYVFQGGLNESGHLNLVIFI